MQVRAKEKQASSSHMYVNRGRRDPSQSRDGSLKIDSLDLHGVTFSTQTPTGFCNLGFCFVLFCFVFVKEETGFLRVWLQALMCLRNRLLTDTCHVAANNKGNPLMFHLLPTKKQDASLPGSQGDSLFEKLTPCVWSPVGLGVQ